MQKYAGKISPREAGDVLNGKLPSGTEIPIYPFDEFKRGIADLPGRYGVVLDCELARKSTRGFDTFDVLKDEPNLIARAGGTEPLAAYLDKAQARHSTGKMGNWHPYNRIDPNQPQTRMVFLAGNQGGVGSDDNDDDDYGYDAEYGIGGDACIHNMARYVAVAPRDVSTSVRYLDFETRATVPKRPNQGQCPMTSRTSLHADMRHASGWYAVLPEPPPANRLKGDQTADWVVVGAGITGLAAARRLGELAPHARVLLLDEYRVGYGTSGRNSGFVIDTPHLSENLSEEDNRRVSRLVIAGLADLAGHVQEHGIDCEWSPRGHLSAVVNPRREKKLHATARMLDAADEEYEWYDRKTIARVTGTGYYHGAILTPRTVLVNPAALCRGLGETLPANVEVCEQTPVRRIEPGSPVKIECAEASISARNVLLTTNAFIARLGYLRRDVFPLIACASLSRPLADHEQAAMGGESEWGITGITTMRRTLSNRILVRHGLDYTSDFRLSERRRRQLLESHKVILKKRFPMLANLDFEHTWAGVFCMTRNWASRFGRLEPGVFVSLGYCGVGLARGTISGRLLAEYAMGSESGLISDVQALSQPRPLPPQPFLGIGIQARLAWYRWSSRAEA